jgi:hypothetical protein
MQIFDVEFLNNFSFLYEEITLFDRVGTSTLLVLCLPRHFTLLSPWPPHASIHPQQCFGPGPHCWIRLRQVLFLSAAKLKVGFFGQALPFSCCCFFTPSSIFRFIAVKDLTMSRKSQKKRHSTSLIPFETFGRGV